MERVIVADGCRLYDAEIEECVIGLRSVVRPGARLRRVVMMGADCYETEDQDGEHYVIRDGIVVIPKHAVIPGGTAI